MENAESIEKNRTSLLWTCAGIGVLVAFTIKSCFPTQLSAEDTIKKNIMYISKGDAVNALALMNNNTLNIEAISASMVEGSKVMSAKGGVSEVVVHSPGKEVEGVYAATIKYGNGEVEGSTYMRMEHDVDGIWKIAQTKRSAN